MGNDYGACSGNSDCGRGMWCTTGEHPQTKLAGIYLNCGPRDGIRQDTHPTFCAPSGEPLASANVTELQEVIEMGDPITHACGGPSDGSC